MLQLKNIFKSYTTGDFTQIALDGISLDFRKSEFVAILGPSGSGKTTCLNVIGGLDKYDQGDLIINGTSTTNFKQSDWDAYRNNSVGFIFQNYNLIGHLSLLDNVELGMTLSGVSNAEKKAKALEALEKVGLSDHVHKKPSQLSGGQMQRVAIARALANDPDIILADEPTGALDTHTSIQIMELIKEISKDKLVVMVTHNPDLAHAYADRIIEFKDGEVVSDSNPVEQSVVNANYKLKKTSMKFRTALKLSYKNIMTKKWRTGLTAFASSIGIIGIALILSLSNGFNKKIDEYEQGTLSGFPIQIYQYSQSLSDAMSVKSNDDKEEYSDETEVHPYEQSEAYSVKSNKFTDEYLDYINDIDSSLMSGIAKTYTVNMNLLKSDGKTATPLDTSLMSISSYPECTSGDSLAYIKDNYDLLAGEFPSSSTDIMLVIDSYNQIDTTTLQVLGLDYTKDSISFDDIVGYEIKAIPNDLYYVKSGDTYTINGDPNNLSNLYNDPAAISIKISGIIRMKEDSTYALINSGLTYSNKLTELFYEQAKDSQIVKDQENCDYNVITGDPFLDLSPAEAAIMGATTANKSSQLSQLGANLTPYSIIIYPKDFDSKEEICDYLDEYNDGKDEEDQVTYMDLAKEMTDMAGGIMSGITIVLVAFAAISLVVSLIMIAIITYISVLERTKEIGVLRALGARKKDITRVFNAETFITGVVSGTLGILIALLLTLPINAIIKSQTDLANVAQLNPIHAIILIAISVTLTVLGGLIPARMAAKKDPVEALRAQ